MTSEYTGDCLRQVAFTTGLYCILFLHRNICCGTHSLDVPQRGNYKKHHNIMFFYRNKENINMFH